MRTVVGHITRNIKINAEVEDELGGHLQVYHWLRKETVDNVVYDIDLRGNIEFYGVEMNNMG